MSFDLTERLLPQLDRHLCLPLLDFLDSNGSYEHRDLLHAKLEILKSTNMVTYLAQLDKELDNNQSLQQDCKQREESILSTLKELEGQAQVVMDIITIPEVFQSLKQDKQQNLQFLKDQHNLSVEQIGLLYKLGRFQYTIGQYQAAADYLYHFRVLTVDPELEASAMWGKLASNILDGDWDAALNELDLLRKHIDALYPATSASSNAVVGLQQRTWFLHWSLFVYFNHPEGRDKLVDAWLSQTPLPASLSRDGRDQQAYLLTYLPTLQANAPWLLRYLVAAVVLSKRAAFKGNTYLGALARIATKEQLGTAVLTAIRQETYQYSDPVTDFLRALFFDLDFKAAGEYLKQSEEVVANDFFLAEFKDEWKERARYLYSEAYCRIHNQIDIGRLSSQIGLSNEAGEKWIVNLIRDARMDAKIDLKKNIVQMNRAAPTVAQSVIDKTKAILERSARIDTVPDGQQPQGERQIRHRPPQQPQPQR